MVLFLTIEVVYIVREEICQINIVLIDLYSMIDGKKKKVIKIKILFM